jgi:quinolinate synthase
MSDTENKTGQANSAEMPFLDHLEELRWRLIKCLVAVFLGAIVVYYFGNEAMELLVRPYNLVAKDHKLIFLEPTGAFMVYLEIAFFGGIIISLPVIFFQLWKFVAPGLYIRERSWVTAVIFVSTLSFLIGASFAYLFMVPIGLKFLLGYESQLLEATITVQKYLSFVLTLVFVSGLVFELPLIAFFLTKIGLLTPKFLREKRRYGIVINLTIAAILTPPDVMTQMLLAIPLIFLYEVSIWVSYFALRGKKSQQSDSVSDEPKPKGTGGSPTKPDTDAPTAFDTPVAPVPPSKTVPDAYKYLSDEELTQRIQKVKSELGERLIILGHHYQRDEIINLTDIQGDSFGLSQQAAENQAAQYIVFCGVNFMAESARILARPEQSVLLPDFDAGCPLAEFATLPQVEAAWNAIGNTVDSHTIIPLTYMNSTSEIKAFCGRHGGAVCTSSNAAAAFEWAFQQGTRIFFLPDENLGQNVAAQSGIPADQIVTWNPNTELGGLSLDEIQQARVILWKGHCHVHTLFSIQQIETMREKYPNAQIVVHPECKRPVVALADANGSTEFIRKFVAAAPSGQTLIIGTEINLVQRLAKLHPDKTILPLARSLCPNMYKINLQNLCWTVENLDTVNHVHVPASVLADARLALDRMLRL